MEEITHGDKRASAYFQRMITTVILAGLMYRFIESYLDDIILDGGEWGVLVLNTREVLQRFRNNGVYAHARKCK